MVTVTRSVALTATSDSPSTSSSRLATPGTDGSVDGSEAARSPTPTVSVSPPPSLHSPAPQLRLPTQQGTPPPRESRAESITGGLANGLDNVHLSSPAPATPGDLDMSALATAVENVERGTDEQTPLPETPPATPGALRPPRSTPASQPRTRSPRTRSPRIRSPSQSLTYNIEDEELPPHRLYSPHIQHALRDSKALMASLADALGSSSSRMHADRGSTIHSLHKQATALANFQLPPSWTVGFVGGTGAGGSDGKASTCVATEFRYRAGDNFAIDVELFSEDKLQEQLANLVRSYRSYHLPEEATQAQTADAASANDAAIARNGSKEDAKRALDMLRALFGTQIDTSEQRLLADSEESLLSALGRQLLNNRAALSTQQEVFASVGACSERLKELTVEPREDAPEEPVSWPYIRAIK
ncbi:hypothetical protein Sste5346_009482 [Sporothrix stenoceras]|uniref:Uncharacterized protein n=1 Tax=Sporothrix stenoceras TaxID=5173 RepID=A0ABR3YJV0_9PEZI